jgi:hypothetical protein
MKRKRIFVVKPSVFCGRKEELKELLHIAKKRKLILLPAVKTAFLPAFNQMLKVLEECDIGEIREVRATRTSLYREKNYPDNDGSPLVVIMREVPVPAYDAAVTESGLLQQSNTVSPMASNSCFGVKFDV